MTQTMMTGSILGCVRAFRSFARQQMIFSTSPVLGYVKLCTPLALIHGTVSPDGPG